MTVSADVETVEHLIRARLATAVGGLRGSIEAALPTIAFVVVWLVTSDVRTAVIASLVPVAVLLLARLVQRQTPQYVLSSLVATALAAFFALRSGRAEDAFLPGMALSAAYLAGTLLSILGRVPAVGFLVAIGDPGYREDPLGWRRSEPLVRVSARLTWVLVCLFALRLLVMVPLYLAGQVAALGVAKIALGWPAYLAAVAVMGLILVKGATPVEREELGHEADRQL